jgi:hypothetical protein
MSIFAFSSLFTLVGAAAVVYLLASRGGTRARSLAASDIYVVSVGIVCFIWVGGIVLALVPVMPFAQKHTAAHGAGPIPLLLDAAMLLSGTYASRLRLEIRDLYFVYRGFSESRIPYESIGSLAWKYTGRGDRYLRVKLISGKSLKISGTVYHVDEFAQKLAARTVGITGRSPWESSAH